MKEIFLKNYINDEIVLSGRDKGEKIRSNIKIDLLDDDNEMYQIVIPDSVRTWNPSHFLGIFSKSIKKLGLECFEEKYKFISDTPDKKLKKTIEDDLKEGVEWALDESEILP